MSVLKFIDSLNQMNNESMPADVSRAMAARAAP
jgi:hypothetical protein